MKTKKAAAPRLFGFCVPRRRHYRHILLLGKLWVEYDLKVYVSWTMLSHGLRHVSCVISWETNEDHKVCSCTMEHKRFFNLFSLWTKCLCPPLEMESNHLVPETLNGTWVQPRFFRLLTQFPHKIKFVAVTGDLWKEGNWFGNTSTSERSGRIQEHLCSGIILS